MSEVEDVNVSNGWINGIGMNLFKLFSITVRGQIQGPDYSDDGPCPGLMYEDKKKTTMNGDHNQMDGLLLINLLATILRYCIYKTIEKLFFHVLSIF
jgi:hypothetical protein